MARTSKPKPYNNGQWTQARFNSFIKGLLRKGTMRWGPIQQAKKDARVDRGLYLCNGCKTVVPLTVDKKKNVFVDHIEPIGKFESWDKVVEKMFCEQDNLQVLCKDCHDRKTKEERATNGQR